MILHFPSYNYRIFPPSNDRIYTFSAKSVNPSVNLPTRYPSSSLFGSDGGAQSAPAAYTYSPTASPGKERPDCSTRETRTDCPCRRPRDSRHKRSSSDPHLHARREWSFPDPGLLSWGHLCPGRSGQPRWHLPQPGERSHLSRGGSGLSPGPWTHIFRRTIGLLCCHAVGGR